MSDTGTPLPPVIGAPMAGGVTTPALVAAVTDAGGLGFLAAGYQRPTQLADDIAEVRRRIRGPFGVNVFVPGPDPVDLAAVADYRSALAPTAARFGVDLPQPAGADSDFYPEKIDVVVAARVPVVSFTFGCPAPQVVDRLHAAGIRVVVTVTNAAEARIAAARGADALCVQGGEAGGHRATFTPRRPAPDEPALPELVAAVRRVVTLPLIAAGGVTDADDVSAVVTAGAQAVQVGTALLGTPEAGTHPVHRAALDDPRFDDTVVTTAFSGRPARGLRNLFTDAFEPVAPVAYPHVHHLTKPLRAAAAERGDAHHMALWAGTRHRATKPIPAARVVEPLAAAVLAAAHRTARDRRRA